MTDDAIHYRYDFLLPDGRERTYELRLDRGSLALLPAAPPADLPPWTELGCCRCDNCPLDPAEHRHCPIAANVPDLVGFFGDAASYDDVDVRISTDERSYVKRTRMSEAVSSLLGIYMVTSGCPVMDRLRPMVRFHLPLATTTETTFRALAMYLVAQYFIARRGGTPDWELHGLPRIYEQVQRVNRAFVERLRQATVRDANLNALIRLDAFAGIILVSLDHGALEEIESLFASYLADAGGDDGG